MFISKKDLLKRIQRLEEDVKKLATSKELTVKALTVMVGERNFDPTKDPCWGWENPKISIYRPIHEVIQEILQRLNIEMVYSAEKYEWRGKPSLKAKKKGGLK